MSDAILDAIAVAMAPYTAKKSMETSVKEWDGPFPIVSINPIDRQVIEYHAFGGNVAHKNIKQTYQLTYVNTNNLDDSVDAGVGDFKKKVIDSFMPTPTNLINAGAWYSRVEDNADFKKDLLPVGYVYASCIVKVEFIENP